MHADFYNTEKLLASGRYITRGTAFIILGVMFAAAVGGLVIGYFSGHHAGKIEMQDELVNKGYGTWHTTAIKERRDFQWHSQKD